MKPPKKKKAVLITLLVSFLVLAFFVANQTSERMNMSLSCKPISFQEMLDPRENTAIFEGEEITFDYETTESEMAEPFQCNCHGNWIRGKNYRYQE